MTTAVGVALQSVDSIPGRPACWCWSEGGLAHANVPLTSSCLQIGVENALGGQTNWNMFLKWTLNLLLYFLFQISNETGCEDKTSHRQPGGSE